jgi:hypothetical protein
MSDPLLAGFARIDITPALDHPPSFQILDPIFLRALHLRQGPRQVTFLAADLFLFDEYFFALMARHLEGTDLDADWILPGASHLGTGPTFFQYYVNQPTQALKLFGQEESYARAAAQAVVQAREEAAPARLGVLVGQAERGLSYNRRAHDHEGRLRMVSLTEFPKPPDHLRYGEVDLQVGVLYCRPQGKPPIALVNFGCHALALWDLRGNISGDYPGRMAALLEQEGIDALFAQGALGNVHPVRQGDDPCGRIAASLAATVLKMVHSAKTADDLELELFRHDLELAPREVGDAQAARQHWEAQPANREGLARYEYWLAQHYEHRASCAFPLRAVKLGDSVLLHMPGEPFAETGKAIRAGAPFEHVLILSNPCPEAGYLPTPEAHREGGDEPLFAALEVEAEALIRRAAVELLQRLGQKQKRPS